MIFILTFGLFHNEFSAYYFSTQQLFGILMAMLAHAKSQDFETDQISGIIDTNGRLINASSPPFQHDQKG